MNVDAGGVGHPADLELGSRMACDRVVVDRERDHAGRRGLLPLGRQPRPGQGPDETIIDTFAQANDEGVTLLARPGHPGEHAVGVAFSCSTRTWLNQSNGRPGRIVTTPPARVTVAREVQLATPVGKQWSSRPGER